MNTIAIETIEIDYLNLDDPQGVEKRLAAALRSVARRGSVEWNQSKLSSTVAENNFDCARLDEFATFGVAIASQAGEWNGGGRAYWFEGQVTLELDGYGVLRVWASNAQITVVGRYRTEATRFSGNGANYALAQAYRQVVLRDLGLGSITGWETGRRDSLVYNEWANAIGIREEVLAPAETPSYPIDDEPLTEWERELLNPSS